MDKVKVEVINKNKNLNPDKLKDIMVKDVLEIKFDKNYE